MFEAFLITLIVVGYFVVFFFLLTQSLYDNKIEMVGFVFWCAMGVFLRQKIVCCLRSVGNPKRGMI